MLRIPYAKLRTAEKRFRVLHPDADTIKALWTPASSESEIAVEVWQDGRARVLPA